MSSVQQATTLVVGATGATGKWVVKLLLESKEKQCVKVIVRSKQRMIDLLTELNHDNNNHDGKKDYEDRLTIIEGSLLDFSDSELKKHVEGCNTIICCLGHNLTFKGMYGEPRMLVSRAVERLTNALVLDTTTATPRTSKKYIHMGSDGVANPNGEDDQRTFAERSILSLLRCLVPPHVDNEAAADYIWNSLGTTTKTNAGDSLEWCVVRPTDLIEGTPTLESYKLYQKPVGGLFGSGEATRSNVATFMVDLTINDKLWNEWKYQMPVLHNNKKSESKVEESVEESKKTL